MATKNKNVGSIRRAREEDVSRIAKCFQAAYTDRYPYGLREEEVVRKSLRDPNRAVWVIESSDEVVGTGSAVFTADKNKVELGRDCVHPDYRGITHEGKSAIRSLIETRVEYALKQRADIVHVTAVSTHPKTQIGYGKSDFFPACVEIGKYAVLYADGQRETTFEMISRQSPFFKRQERTSFVPERAFGLASVISQGLGYNCKLESSNARNGNIDVKVDADAVSDHALITITPGNRGVEEAMDEIYTALGKYTYVQAKVAAINGITGDVCRRLEDVGLEYSGFLPGWIKSKQAHHDAVVMQIKVEGIDPSKIHMIDTTRNLSEMIGYNTEACPEV